MMQIAGSWIEMATFAALVIGGVWTLVQWRKSIRVQRANTLSRLLEVVCNGENRVYLTYNVYVMEMGGRGRVEFYKGNLEFAHASDKEHIDTMLMFFNQVCYMKTVGLIDNCEFQMFQAQICNVFNNQQIGSYFSDLENATQNAFPYSFLKKHYIRASSQTSKQKGGAV